MARLSLSKLGAQARVLLGVLSVPVIGLGFYVSRERQRAQTALRDSEERFRWLRMEKTLEAERNILRTLIDNLPDFIFIKDTASRIVLNNAAHRRHLEVKTLEEAVGKTDFDFAFQAAEADQYYADEQHVIHTGEPMINREEPATSAYGHKQWLLTTKVPLRASNGQIVGIVGISHDITERQQMEIAEHEQ